MASKISEKDFKIVPHSLEEITADWCEKILRDGSTIAIDTTVTNVEVLPITDELHCCFCACSRLLQLDTEVTSAPTLCRVQQMDTSQFGV